EDRMATNGARTVMLGRAQKTAYEIGDGNRPGFLDHVFELEPGAMCHGVRSIPGSSGDKGLEFPALLGTGRAAHWASCCWRGFSGELKRRACSKRRVSWVSISTANRMHSIGRGL